MQTGVTHVIIAAILQCAICIACFAFYVSELKTSYSLQILYYLNQKAALRHAQTDVTTC